MNVKKALVLVSDLFTFDACFAAGGAPYPAPAKGPGDHLRNVFYRMGFNDQEIVALSGKFALRLIHHSHHSRIHPCY